MLGNNHRNSINFPQDNCGHSGHTYVGMDNIWPPTLPQQSVKASKYTKINGNEPGEGKNFAKETWPFIYCGALS